MVAIAVANWVNVVTFVKCKFVHTFVSTLYKLRAALIDQNVG